jgi:hypothetical protein
MRHRGDSGLHDGKEGVMSVKKSGLAAVAAAELCALGTAGAWAADADSGNFTVRITPNVDFGLTVDTSGSRWNSSANLDVALNLGTEELLAVPVKVTMTGNFNNQEMTLSAAALDTWVLDTDEVDVLDQMRLYGMFGRDAYASSPAPSQFNGTTNLIVAGAGQAGQAQANEAGDTLHKYELATAAAEYFDVDGMAVGQIRRLWLRSRTPSTTTSAGQQRFTVTVTAVSGAGS